ncbi:hypothetical protein BR93DRAFT_969175 [Coniochaeta sp. PMI_546]|nr:hypothetical protein BR93DRAFT_969175 [Coniochaeta sp. PMI_546]
MPSHDPKAGVILMRKLGVAVASLKVAISDPVECMGADVLAAVSLLSSYECIESTHAAAWINHHKGLYRLLEKRGPSRYRSDFERQLLLAAIGVIFTISLREDHSCFLERPEWQAILATKPADSIILEEWTDSWRCLPLMCLIPSLLSSCRDIVRKRASQTAEKIEALVTSTSSLRASFLDMAEKYGWKSGRYSPVLAPRNAAKDDWRLFNDAEDQRAANYGNYLSALVIINRILYALRPSAEKLEEESRLLSLEIQYLHTFLKTEPLLRKLYLVHSERVALSILLTSAHWASDRTQENGIAFDPKAVEGGHIIEQWKFDTFDDILCARSVSADLM